MKALGETGLRGSVTALVVVCARLLRRKQTLNVICAAIVRERADPHPRKSRASVEFWGDAIGAYSGLFLAYAIVMTGCQLATGHLVRGRVAYPVAHLPLLLLAGGGFASMYMYLAITKRRVGPSLRPTNAAYAVGLAGAVVVGVALW